MELWDPGKQEVIFGVVYDMSPSPKRRHTRVDENIFNKLKNSFKDSRCEIFIEQLDFYFHYEEDKNDYIIPDIAIVCDWGKNDRRYHGTPRFVVAALRRRYTFLLFKVQKPVIMFHGKYRFMIRWHMK